MYQQYPPQQPAYYPQQQYSGCLKAFLYGLSLLIPIAGIIVGVVFVSRPDQESKSIGNTSLILGVISFVINCCLVIAIWALMSAGMIPFLMDM
jgi:hypothetical protein